jgi:hypothetical protein
VALEQLVEHDAREPVNGLARRHDPYRSGSVRAGE